MSVQGGSTWFLKTPDDRFLLVLRGDKASIPYPNTWVFPRGTIETGESPEQTAIRELYEEFRFTPPSLEKVLILFHTRKGVEEHFYLIPIPNDMSSLELHEGQRMQLFNLDEIGKLNLGWWSREVLPILRRYITDNTRLSGNG